MQFDVKTVDEILGVDESYKAPEKMLSLMLDDNARVVLDAAKFMDNRTDINSNLPHMIGVEAPHDTKKK